MNWSMREMVCHGVNKDEWVYGIDKHTVSVLAAVRHTPISLVGWRINRTAT